jgi:hypothetical protein
VVVITFAEMSKELTERLAATEGLVESIIDNCASKNPSKKGDSRPLIECIAQDVCIRLAWISWILI